LCEQGCISDLWEDATGNFRHDTGTLYHVTLVDRIRSGNQTIPGLRLRSSGLGDSHSLAFLDDHILNLELQLSTGNAPTVLCRLTEFYATWKNRIPMTLVPVTGTRHGLTPFERVTIGAPKVKRATWATVIPCGFTIRNGWRFHTTYSELLHYLLLIHYLFIENAPLVQIGLAGNQWHLCGRQ
jgi:hypothetical protein